MSSSYKEINNQVLIETEIFPRLTKMGIKYSHLNFNFIEKNNHIKINLSYRLDNPHEYDRFGVFLRELDRQKRLIPLIRDFLKIQSSIVACYTTKSIFIDINKLWKNNQIDCLYDSLDSLLYILNEYRTDMFLNVLLKFKQKNNIPYLKKVEFNSHEHFDFLDYNFVLLDNVKNQENLVYYDTSLVTMNEDQLEKISSFLAQKLKSFILCKEYFTIKGKSAEVVSIYTPSQHDVINNNYLFHIRNNEKIVFSNSLHIQLNKENENPPNIYKGNLVANWLFKEIIGYIFSKLNNKIHPAIEIIGKNTSNYQQFICSLNGECIISPTTKKSNDIAILVLLPDADINWNEMPCKSIVIDLYGIAKYGYIRNALSSEIIYIEGICLECNDIDIITDKSLLNINKSLSFIEGVLDVLFYSKLTDDEKNKSTSDDFLELVNKFNIKIKALKGREGEIVETHLKTFPKIEDSWNYLCSNIISHSEHIACQSESKNNTNLCHYIFDKKNLESKSVIIDPENKITMNYKEIFSMASNIAHEFSNRGYKKGDVIALSAVDTCTSVAVMLGCMMGGWIFCPINYHASQQDIMVMLNAADPKLLIYSNSEACMIAKDIANCECIELNKFILNTFAINHTKIYPITMLKHSWPAVMLFTSGSTGTPKALLHSHGDFINCNQNYVRYVIQIKKYDKVFSPSRLFFAYGLNNILISLYSGATHILATPLSKSMNMLQLIDKYNVSVILAVPIMYKLMLSLLDENINFPKLRLCISAGEALPSKLLFNLKDKLGVPVLDGIGMTEAISTFISSRLGNILPNCTGTLVPGFTAELRREDGSICSIGEVGTLWIRGNTLTEKYLNSTEQNEKTFIDGWLNTNDLFFTDYRQRFYYVGRSGRVIKINGCWCSPQMMEKVIISHPNIYDCAVCIIKDEYGLDRTRAFIVLDEKYEKLVSMTKLSKELHELSRRKLGKFQYPHSFFLVKSLPRTGSGKLNLNNLLNYKDLALMEF
ncbi:AMP-binding protein [Xenorhabdus sp. SGI246]|uniref:AMP-binding protein n=1 Tax=Xenorhabdus sp. SGI246 TaxID=3158263 RepID=UPI00349F6162